MYRIVVANLAAGVGKTTIATHLAASLTRRHRAVPLVTATCPAEVRAASQLGHDGFVVVDAATPPGDALALGGVVDGADFVLVPLTPDPEVVDATIHTIQQVLEPHQLRFAVVLNRIDLHMPGEVAGWDRLLDVTYGFPREATHLPLLPAATPPAHVRHDAHATGAGSKDQFAAASASLARELAGQATADAGMW